MLLDYHSYYGTEPPPAPTHGGSLVFDWYQQRRRKPKPQPKRPQVDIRIPAVHLTMDVTLPAMVQTAFGRVRVRSTSYAALRLLVTARAMVKLIALSRVETWPPEMQAAVNVIYGSAMDLPVPQPEAQGNAVLKVLAGIAASIPNAEASAAGQARIVGLHRARLLVPGLRAAMKVDEQQDIDDDALMALAQELLLDDDEDEE